MPKTSPRTQAKTLKRPKLRLSKETDPSLQFRRLPGCWRPRHPAPNASNLAHAARSMGARKPRAQLYMGWHPPAKGMGCLYEGCGRINLLRV